MWQFHTTVGRISVEKNKMKKENGLDCQACCGVKRRLKVTGFDYLPTGPGGCGASAVQASWGRVLWGRLSPQWASAVGVQQCWTIFCLPRLAPPLAPRLRPSRRAERNLPSREGHYRPLTHCVGRRRTNQLHRRRRRRRRRRRKWKKKEVEKKAERLFW